MNKTLYFRKTILSHDKEFNFMSCDTLRLRLESLTILDGRALLTLYTFETQELLQTHVMKVFDLFPSIDEIDEQEYLRIKTQYSNVMMRASTFVTLP